MKPLSPFKFFLENKKRTTIILIVLMLSVAVVSFITSMVTSVIIDSNNAALKPYEYCSTVAKTPGEIFMKDSLVQEVSTLPEVDQTIEIVPEQTIYDSFMGDTSVPIYFIEDGAALQQAMVAMHLTLKAGRLPSGDTHEVVLHEKLLKNKGLQVGDSIGSEVQDDESLSGRYKIVGSLEGDAIIGFGSTSVTAAAYQEMAIDAPQALMLIPEAGQLSQLNRQLDQIEKQDAVVHTHTALKEIADDQLTGINMMLKTIIVILVFILSVSVGALVYIIYLGRSDEFGILYAMGYRNSFITRMVLKELTVLSICSWVIGYFFSIVLIYAINALLLADKGQHLYMFTMTGFTNTLFIPAMVLICASFPIVRRLRKWDPIAVIERRD